MFGKKFEEYVRFDRWILILIGLVFVVRLGMSLAGVSISETRFVSVNLVLLVGLVYCAVAVHTTGFGSYKHLFPLLLLQISVAHSLIALAIVLGIVTGQHNIFTDPEFFGGTDGRNWFHVGLHLIVGPILTVFYWPLGALILFVTRKLRP